MPEASTILINVYSKRKSSYSSMPMLLLFVLQIFPLHTFDFERITQYSLPFFQVTVEKGKELERVYYGHTEIVKLLNQQKNLTTENNELFKETLLKVINDDSKSIQNNEHMKKEHFLTHFLESTH